VPCFIKFLWLTRCDRSPSDTRHVECHVLFGIMHASAPCFKWGPRGILHMFIELYKHACRLRLEKLLCLELSSISRSSNGFFSHFLVQVAVSEAKRPLRLCVRSGVTVMQRPWPLAKANGFIPKWFTLIINGAKPPTHQADKWEYRSIIYRKHQGKIVNLIVRGLKTYRKRPASYICRWAGLFWCGNI
jgi:hypothetical protein